MRPEDTFEVHRYFGKAWAVKTFLRINKTKQNFVLIIIHFISSFSCKIKVPNELYSKKAVRSQQATTLFAKEVLMMRTQRL